MTINWKVRLKNKNFWVAIVPALLLVVQAVAGVFGFEIDLSTLCGKILVVIDAVFVVLSILGIVNDPTTATLSDSNLAMTYDEPKVRG